MTITLYCFKSPLTRIYALTTIGAAIQVTGLTGIELGEGPPIATRVNGGPCRAVMREWRAMERRQNDARWPP